MSAAESATDHRRNIGTRPRRRVPGRHQTAGRRRPAPGALLLAVTLVAVAAVPAAASLEPTGVISPPASGVRTAAFSGDHAVFGYYKTDSEVEGRRAGLVKVYAETATGWELAADLEPEGLGARAGFGGGLAIQSDTLAVGASGDAYDKSPAGRVRLFTGAGATWTVVDTLVSPVSAKRDRFGFAIGLDGDILCVGAPGTSAAYVYERTAGVWSLVASLSPRTGDTSFGRAVKVSGTTIAVGASQAIYVFAEGAGGWERQGRIPTPDAYWRNLALSGDTIAFDDSLNAIRVYQRSADAWSYAQKITKPPDVPSWASTFPQGLALHGDTMVIGDDLDTDQTGVINVYGRVGGTWMHTDVIPSPSGYYNGFPSQMTFADSGELLVGHGAYYSELAGDFYVYGPIEGETCRGEIITLAGTDGDDVLVGTNGRDVIHGMGGDDVIDGKGGDDVLCGGAGNDTVSFEHARWVRADLTAGSAEANHGTNLLDGFENITGSRGGDVLIGDAADNILRGMGGKDTLQGMQGKDTLDGGTGVDTASYLGATGPVTVNLATGHASGADEVDTLVDIEGLTGSDYSDVLIGDAGANQLQGMGGDDTLDGGLGNDVLGGGAGSKDVAEYPHAPAAIVADLRTGLVTGGGGKDRLRSIESVTGSGFDDVLIGNGKNNALSGGDGDDYLDGQGGNDILRGGAHDNYYVPGPGNDTVRADLHMNNWMDIVSYEFSSGPVTVILGKELATGQGRDKLINVDGVVGSPYGDVLDGRTDGYSGFFVPLAGDDVVKGTKGDQVIFAYARRGITLNLASGTATGEGSDRIYGVRQAVGTPFADTMTGSSDADALWSLAGDDTLRGGSGDDYLDGGEDRDRIEGGYGTDRCRNGEIHLSCEYYRDQSESEASDIRPVTAIIREFMELEARYR